MTYDASDRRHVRIAEKAARLAARQDEEVVKALMSTPQGRQYIYNKLTSAHVFSTSFDRNALQMAFAEGERNQGLQLLNDIMKACPQQYILMVQEENTRDLARQSERSERSRTNSDGRDSGPGIEARSDFDPFEGDRDREGNPRFEGYDEGR